jgi:hypothetical protein
MARYPGAQWRPIAVNFTPASISPNLLVEHIMQGTLAGTDSWFRNPQAGASAHFGVGTSGTVYQWVDTHDVAWHAVDANGRSIGVEHEGWSGTPLTGAQLDATAAILAWAATVHPVPLKLAQSVTDTGLAWHGLGGAAWGNHPDCPGQPIVDQLPQVLAAAQGQPATTTEDDVFYLQFDAGDDSTIVVPNQYAAGTSRIRFGCKQATVLRVDTAGSGTQQLTLGYNAGAQGFQIAAGCKFMVVHRDSGTSPVAVTFS